MYRELCMITKKTPYMNTVRGYLIWILFAVVVYGVFVFVDIVKPAGLT